MEADALETTCPARAALAGNPSDGYGGAVVAVPVPALTATVTAEPADRFAVTVDDPDLHRLLSATADGYDREIGPLPSVRVAARTTIPRSVGLAGSSAFVIAALRTLARADGRGWDDLALADLALRVERDRLGIAAGLQDRLVQSVGRIVMMRFDPVGVEPIRVERPPALFVAWATAAAAPSGVVHRSLRQRFDDGEDAVVDAMRRLPILAEQARRGLVDGDHDAVAAAMDATFDLRDGLLDVGDLQRELIGLGRRHGAATNSAGSGGSVVGLARDVRHRDDLVEQYRRAGFEAVSVTGAVSQQSLKE